VSSPHFPSSLESLDLVLTSPYIDLNVLSIDEDTVLVNEDCTGVRKMLDAAGFTTVPVRHRHRRLFGGDSIASPSTPAATAAARTTCHSQWLCRRVGRRPHPLRISNNS
jgi:hypothetical protein